MNLFQRIRDSITKVEDFWNWCKFPFNGITRRELVPEEQENNHPNRANCEEQGTINPSAVGSREPDFSPIQNHDCRKKYKCIKVEVKFWFEILGVIGGFIVLVLIYKQYGEMTKVTSLTLDAVKISQEQAVISKRQLDNSEAQQRAWLRFDTFQIQRTAIRLSPTPYNKDMYKVKISMIIRNYGSTPAIDLFVTGESLQSSVEKFYGEHGLTNEIRKWDGTMPIPNPSNRGLGIMPQETYTNSFITGEFPAGDDVYFEYWLSYRDIFGHSWIIGEGGTYRFTNDVFEPQFFNYGITTNHIQNQN